MAASLQAAAAATFMQSTKVGVSNRLQLNSSQRIARLSVSSNLEPESAAHFNPISKTSLRNVPMQPRSPALLLQLPPLLFREQVLKEIQKD